MTRRINARDFLDKNAEQNLCVLDVRTAGEVNAEHLPQCIHVPLHELTPERLAKRLAAAGADSAGTVYLLCQSGNRAEQAAQKLQEALPDLELCVVNGGVQGLKAEGALLSSSVKGAMSLERQVRIAAGSLVVLGVILGIGVHPALFIISAFVGAGLVFSGITDTCGMAMILSNMPWNRAKSRTEAKAS